MYLENIYSPEDVKKLSIEELNKLIQSPKQNVIM